MFFCLTIVLDLRISPTNKTYALDDPDGKLHVLYDCIRGECSYFTMVIFEAIGLSIDSLLISQERINTV